MRFPSWLTWYKKPEYRDIKEYSTAVRSGRRQLSPDGRGKTSIPSRLKLERILENKTCSPMSLYDFYMYLKYIEFSAENLEFYLWYRNYEMAWLKAGGSERDSQSLHSVPESTSSQVYLDLGEKLPRVEMSEFTVDPEVARDTIDRITQMINPDTACTLNASDCGRPNVGERIRSFIKPDSTHPPTTQIHGNGISTFNSSPGSARAELHAVVETYLLPGSEKELNLPPGLRDQALADIIRRSSSDPAHLKPVADHVYGLLRNCSHRNFVRLGVSNGTFETVCVATGLGIVLTCAGFLVALLRGLATPGPGANPRWEVFACWPLWWLGVSLVLSGVRGSCFFLLLFSRRQPLPWERFDDDNDNNNGDSAAAVGAQAGGRQRSALVRVLGRLMIFDRKFKVKDRHLRRLQRKIVIQSLVGGAVFASLAVVLFIFLPIWRETVRR